MSEDASVSAPAPAPAPAAAPAPAEVAAAATESEAAAAPAAAAASEGDAVEATASGGDGDSKAAEESTEAPKRKRKRWLPLESNPDVMNKYIAGLGFPTVMYKFVDVLALEDWALEMVPSPARAIMLLFPISEMSEKHRAEEAANIEEKGQEVSDNLYYTKQTVGNACGTVGLIHAVSNCADVLSGDVPITAGTFFHNFLSRTKGMTPDERATALEDDEALDAAQAVATQEGQTAPPELHEAVNAHFICFVSVDGHLYELDGRKKFPINHGACTTAELKTKAAAVVKQFMARDPTSYNFAITALVPNTD